MSAIGRELVDGIVDLVEQRLNLRGAAGILVGHDVSDDLATVGIQRQFRHRRRDLAQCFSSSHWPAP